MLAGISAEYCLRLERGRDPHPSVQVLESIARVLQLDDEHLAYLHSASARRISVSPLPPAIGKRSSSSP